MAGVRPAVEGLPAHHPRCPWCDRPLLMHVKEFDAAGVSRWAGGRKPYARIVFEGWRGYGSTRWATGTIPIFDRLRCALDFAEASYRGGFRRKPHA